MARMWNNVSSETLWRSVDSHPGHQWCDLVNDRRARPGTLRPHRRDMYKAVPGSTVHHRGQLETVQMSTLGNGYVHFHESTRL